MCSKSSRNLTQVLFRLCPERSQAVILLFLQAALKLGRLRESYPASWVLSPSFPRPCPPQAIFWWSYCCSCTSGRVGDTSCAVLVWLSLQRLMEPAQGGMSCGDPATYLVMPGVAAVWKAKAEAVAKTGAGRRMCMDWPARALVTGEPATLPAFPTKECWARNRLHP